MIDFAKYRTVDDVHEVALLRYYVYRSVVIISSLRVEGNRARSERDRNSGDDR